MARIVWEGTEEQERTERLKACAARRAQWGDDDCDRRDWSCSECEIDMAEALETEASKQRRSALKSTAAKEGGE